MRRLLRDMCRHMPRVTSLLARDVLAPTRDVGTPVPMHSLLAHEGTAHSCMTEPLAYEQSTRARDVGTPVPNEQAPRA